MKLKDYLDTHDGTYMIAETSIEIAPDELVAAWGENDVEDFVVGDDGGGHRKIHLYALMPRVHVATLLSGSRAPVSTLR